MKKLLKKTLAKAGLKVQRITPHDLVEVGKWDFNNPFEVKKFLMNDTNKAITIFDIGAFDGTSAIRYNNIFPASKIYSFEPFPESYSKLVENVSAHDNIISINKGIGEEIGSATFNSNSFAQTNSLLNTDQASNETWGEGLLDTLEKIEVELTTVDAFVKENNIKNIDILKLDVQGAEYQVIKGAKEALTNGIIKVFYTEIITMPTYEGQLDMDETINLLKSFGYELYNIYNPSLTDEGKLRQIDAIFVKSAK